MKGGIEVVLMVIFFVAGAVLMAYADELSVIPYLGPVSSALATLVAAFVGAWYAFRLHAIHLDKETAKKQVAAGNMAIFELARTFNQFLAIKKQFIDEYRGNSGRQFLILPMPSDLHRLLLDFDNLAFLFDSNDPNLLGRLAAFEQDVASTLGVIELRSRLHAEVVQPAAEALEKRVGGLLDTAQLDAELGRRNAQTIKMLTDSMIEDVDDVIKAAQVHIEEIRHALREKFKGQGHVLIGLSVPNQSQSTPKTGTV